MQVCLMNEQSTAIQASFTFPYRAVLALDKSIEKLDNLGILYNRSVIWCLESVMAYPDLWHEGKYFLMTVISW